MIKENDEKVQHLNVTHIMNRKVLGTDKPMIYGRFWQNMYLSPCDIHDEEQLRENAVSFGEEVTKFCQDAIMTTTIHVCMVVMSQNQEGLQYIWSCSERITLDSANLLLKNI